MPQLAATSLPSRWFTTRNLPHRTVPQRRTQANKSGSAKRQLSRNKKKKVLAEREFGSKRSQRNDLLVPNENLGPKQRLGTTERSSSSSSSATALLSGRGSYSVIAMEGTTMPPILRKPLAWYSTKLETHPLTTKCLTSGLIAGSGNVLCQYLEHRNSDTFGDPESEHNGRVFTWDKARTGRFSLLAFLMVAPATHFWYGALMTRFPGRTNGAVFRRLFCDQAIFAPIFLPTFMVNLMMLEGRDGSEVPSVLKQEVPGALVTNWCLWIPAQIINFGYVPGKFQVLFSNVVGLVWNVYFSWKTNRHVRGN